MSEANAQNTVNASFARPSASLVRALHDNTELRSGYLDALALMQDLVLPLFDGPDKPRFSPDDAVGRLNGIVDSMEASVTLHRHMQKNKAALDAILSLSDPKQSSQAAATFAAGIAAVYAQLIE